MTARGFKVAMIFLVIGVPMALLTWVLFHVSDGAAWLAWKLHNATDAFGAWLNPPRKSKQNTVLTVFGGRKGTNV